MLRTQKHKTIRNSFWFQAAVAAAAVLVLLSVALLGFHHHDDGFGHTGCTLCRLSQEILCCFLLLAFISIFSLESPRKFSAAGFKDFQSFLFISPLQDRAPPSLV